MDKNVSESLTNIENVSLCCQDRPLLDEPRHVLLPHSHFCLKLSNFFLQGVLNLELRDLPSVYIR